MAATQANLIVFRETKARITTETLLHQLSERITKSLRNKQGLLDALIRAGELECALSDANCSGKRSAAELTDGLATLLVHPEVPPSNDLHRLLQQVTKSGLPPSVCVSPPEGFAYYALHPLDFADLALQLGSEISIAVIGIRSIGTVLSAVVAAGLRARGHSATRITVRPTGHPFDRSTEFSPEQVQWISEHNLHRSRFCVVDEGPGLSGSSFLSVGEAVLATGIPESHHADWYSRSRSCKALRGERETSMGSLCSRNGKASLL